MKQAERRNFLYILAVVAYVSVSPSTAAEAVEKPIINLTSPSGGLVWGSGYVEVTRGYSFVFSCSFTSSYSPDLFILKFSGLGYSKNYQPDLFIFSAADYEHEGNYSCVYEGNKNHTAPESDLLYVIIKSPLLNLLIYSVVPGATLLILVVVLVVVLVCRRRRRGRHQETVTLNQRVVRNNYNNDDEEEEDYINVDSGNTNRKSNPAVQLYEEEENENNYEMPDNEDHNDYENVDDDNIVRATTLSITAMNRREEDCDEEESSGDEHDYVNLECVSTQTSDIYDGQQDIYQNI